MLPFIFYFLVMRQIADMHIHSKISEDSQASPDEICLNAIDKNIEIIAFTEHVDFNPADQGYRFFDPLHYSQEISRIRQRYSDKITILKGGEFSEPHLYKKEFQRLAEENFDVLLGSVHMIDDKFVGDETILEKYSLEKLYLKYYQIMLNMVQFGKFDVLAHFDFPKRYYHQKFLPDGIIEEILSTMIEKNIALEVNTSPLRKNFHESTPDRDILSIYASLGGKRVTIGSDAHFPEDIGADFQYAFDLIDDFKNLIPGYFVQREFTPILL